MIIIVLYERFSKMNLVFELRALTRVRRQINQPQKIKQNYLEECRMGLQLKQKQPNHCLVIK